MSFRLNINPWPTAPAWLLFPLAYLLHSSIYFWSWNMPNLLLSQAVCICCSFFLWMLFLSSTTFTWLSPSCHSSLISLKSPSHHPNWCSSHSDVLHGDPCRLSSSFSNWHFQESTDGLNTLQGGCSFVGFGWPTANSSGTSYRYLQHPRSKNPVLFPHIMTWYFEIDPSEFLLHPYPRKCARTHTRRRS